MALALPFADTCYYLEANVLDIFTIKSEVEGIYLL